MASELHLDPKVAGQIEHFEQFKPVAAHWEDLPKLHPSIAEGLAKQGIDRLYAHQVSAFRAAMLGDDVIITTGTNSGKSLCYSLPAMEIAMREPAARALFLFPTKALAQDQLQKLEQLAPSPQIRVGTYDGDTPKSHRAAIRNQCHFILTNPDMLHVGVLPGHDLWAKFLKSVRLVVIDEMHAYRGIFGSNVGNVVRRLLRMCEFYRSRPQIIATSATIGNPQELFTQLTGRNGQLIDRDGSPSGRRSFAFFNPPELDSGARLSANVATAEILASLVESGTRTLAFSRARVSAELVLRYARKRLSEEDAKRVESYRAGYTAQERRKIEKDLFRGQLLGLSATNAMELGVDVGELEAVVINGYPGTVSSFRQQAGRAGRGSRDGLTVFVAHDEPLEQFLVRRPDMLLKSSAENVAINPQNPTILSQHLLCAAHERPMSLSELDTFGPTALDLAEQLDRAGELAFRAGLFFYPAFDPPALKVNIRSAGGEQVRLVVDGNELGTMERARALTSAHAGAVYLHRGASYLVTELNLEQNLATVVAKEVGYFTQAIVASTIQDRFDLNASPLATLVAVTVTEHVEAFRMRSWDGDRILGVEELDLPATSYETLAIRFDLPVILEEKDAELQIGGVHGAEHALLAIAPLLAGCDRQDLGSAWYTLFPDKMRPAIFVFDKTPGGVGLADRLYAQVGDWIAAAAALVESCGCEAGCPACLLSPRCEVLNEALSKMGTLSALKEIADRR